MKSDIISLRYDGTCSRCAVRLPAESKAHWDKSAHTVTCLDCGKPVVEAVESRPLEVAKARVDAPPLAVPASGAAGASAARVFDLRHARREANLDKRFGRLAGVVKFLVDDPQSTRAWARGSAGERALAASLQRRIGDRAVLLHNRRIPRSVANIDHLAVAASGVWVIDAKTYSGRVERRDKGGWFTTDYHLYVNRRDRTSLVAGLEKQRRAVDGVLADTPVTIHSALCFIDAEWGLFASPFQVNGVWVTWGKALADMISAPGPLNGDDVLRIANALAEGLPPAVPAHG